MINPQKGDRFHEFYTFWGYVVKVSERYVWTMEASAPCVFPDDGILKKMTKKQFRIRFSREDPKKPDSYWITLQDRGNDVDGWYQFEKRQGYSI